MGFIFGNALRLHYLCSTELPENKAKKRLSRMIKILIPLIAATVWADIRMWRRRLSPAIRSRLMKWLLGAWLVLTDLTIPLSMLIFRLQTDNPTSSLQIMGWINLFWICTVLPRMILYIGYAARRRIWQAAGWVAACGIVALFLWGTLVCRDRLRVEEVTVTSAKLPAAFDGLRIAFFSDLHIGSLLRPELEVARLVDRLNSLKPDLILFGGDLVNIRYTELDSVMSAQLGRLKAPLGIYSVTGNHDTGVYIRDSMRLSKEINTARLIARQRAMGWSVLDNETIILKRGGDSLSLTGISFDVSLRNFRHAYDLPETDTKKAYGTTPTTLYNITLCHLPQLWDRIAADGYGDLTLSGHVHSMQMKLPLCRRGISPARILYKRWSGTYHEQQRTLYINDGIGAVGIPTRIGASPEITLLTLRCEE